MAEFLFAAVHHEPNYQFALPNSALPTNKLSAHRVCWRFPQLSSYLRGSGCREIIKSILAIADWGEKPPLASDFLPILLSLLSGNLNAGAIQFLACHQKFVVQFPPLPVCLRRRELLAIKIQAGFAIVSVPATKYVRPNCKFVRVAVRARVLRWRLLRGGTSQQIFDTAVELGFPKLVEVWGRGCRERLINRSIAISIWI